MSYPQSSAISEVMAAVWRNLSTDGELTNLVRKVYFGRAPVNATYPYAALGTAIERPDNTNPYQTVTGLGRIVELTLHAYGQTNMQDLALIGDRLVAALESQPLWGMANWTWNRSNYEGSNVVEELDGITLHGIYRFSFRVSL